MLNNRIFILLLCMCCVAGTCRIKTMPFKETNVDSGFFRNVPALCGNSAIKSISSVDVYKAVLTEELVDRDGIPEYKLINQESQQATSDLIGRKNYHVLFLCVLNTNRPSEKLGVFVASSFNVDSECTRLGPAYLGTILSDRFRINKKMKIKMAPDGSYLLSDSSESKLIFLADQPIPRTRRCDTDSIVSGDCDIRIREIINRNINKIGGKKATMYDTQKIFADPDALLFRYERTIKIKL